MTIRGSILYQMPLLFTAWIAILAGVTLFIDEAPAHVVLFPAPGLMQHLPDDASIIGYTGWSVTLVSSEPDFAKRLYASGALLVLPGQLAGCIGTAARPSPSSPSAR